MTSGYSVAGIRASLSEVKIRVIFDRILLLKTSSDFVFLFAGSHGPLSSLGEDGLLGARSSIRHSAFYLLGEHSPRLVFGRACSDAALAACSSRAP